MGTNAFKKNILITGGAGFIGSHVVRLFTNRFADYRVICYDDLTYAGNLRNLEDVKRLPNFVFVKGDICDFSKVKKLFSEYEVDNVIHLAAESHVDRSIRNPLDFARTNVMGTLTLLQCAKEYWESRNWIDSFADSDSRRVFYHISTDEVYGALEIDKNRDEPPYGELKFTEATPYSPHSPYSASKASSDHFVRAYHDTYGLPVVITNCSNNYGPYQFPEKLIPLIINNIVNRRPLPVYGKGENVRDWLFVEDHAEAIATVFHKGKIGETYNIGGENEWRNIDLIKEIVIIADRLLGRPEGDSLDLIKFVTDRKGHDLRYAIDASKIKNELGWKPAVEPDEGLEKTIKWYLDNSDWLLEVTSGKYMDYYRNYYGKS